MPLEQQHHTWRKDLQESQIFQIKSQIKSLKAKFHYASWFGAGSEPVRSWFGAGSGPVRGWLGAGSDWLRTGSEPVRSWFELKFGLSSSLLAAN